MFMGGRYDCVSAAEKINPYPVAKKFKCETVLLFVIE